MGFTHEEFIRIISTASFDYRYKIDGRLVTIELPEGSLEITLGDTTDRKLGSLSLPSTQVEFRFFGLSAVERVKFLESFDRYFQRGGG
jgi:hypothetical protein